jgi:hypothetical protein
MAVTSEALPSYSVAQLGAQIPGLAAADVKLNLEPKGFTCEGPTSFLDGVDYIRDFHHAPTYSERVEITGMSPSDIRSVESTFFWFGAKAQLDANADAFLGYMATLPYEGASPEPAKTWVTSHQTGETSFGPAKYALTTAPTGLVRTLDVTGK